MALSNTFGLYILFTKTRRCNRSQSSYKMFPRAMLLGLSKMLLHPFEGFNVLLWRIRHAHGGIFEESEQHSPRAHSNGPLWFQCRKLIELLNMLLKFSQNRWEHAFSQLIIIHNDILHLNTTVKKSSNISWNSISLKQSPTHPAFWERVSFIRVAALRKWSASCNSYKRAKKKKDLIVFLKAF